MHILKISTLVISLLNTKFMPCFFPCKHKKTRPVHKELGEGERDVCCDKKDLSSTSLSPLAAPIDYQRGYRVCIRLASIRSC